MIKWIYKHMFLCMVVIAVVTTLLLFQFEMTKNNYIIIAVVFFIIIFSGILLLQKGVLNSLNKKCDPYLFLDLIEEQDRAFGRKNKQIYIVFLINKSTALLYMGRYEESQSILIDR